MMTLLEMTQDILSSMSSDEVNSISDTPESLQVAHIIKSKFYDIIDRVPMTNLERLVQLDAIADTSQPVVMTVPDNVVQITSLKYYDNNVLDGTSVSGFQHDLNTDIATTSGGSSATPPGYLDVIILPNKEFINLVSKFNPQNTDVISYSYIDPTSGRTYTLNYFNDRQPRYCSIFNNKTIIFDSYDNTVDDTLQTSKTMAFAQVQPTFLMQDTYIPELPSDQFQLLFNEAKALAFFELKQQPHQLAMQEAKRGWSAVQKNKAIANRPSYFNELPNFGRWGRGGWGAAMSYFKMRGFDR